MNMSETHHGPYLHTQCCAPSAGNPTSMAHALYNTHGNHDAAQPPEAPASARPWDPQGPGSGQFLPWMPERVPTVPCRSQIPSGPPASFPWFWEGQHRPRTLLTQFPLPGLELLGGLHLAGAVVGSRWLQNPDSRQRGF